MLFGPVILPIKPGHACATKLPVFEGAAHTNIIVGFSGGIDRAEYDKFTGRKAK